MHNKVALVTGGSRGIGRAISLALAANGSKVAVNYNRSESKANMVVSEIESSGGTSCAIKADVQYEQQAEQLIQQVVNIYGGIDILVNNAGIDLYKPAIETTAEDFDRVIDINLKGSFFVGREAIRQMLSQGRGGRVINITSDFGYMGREGFSVYCASKAGVIGLTRAWAVEFAPDILVNAIAPGPVETDMAAELTAEQYAANANEVPLKRFADPAEIASVAVFLASTGSSYLTGQTIGANGGSIML